MVEIFKTNVIDIGTSKMLTQKLERAFPDNKINFDLEDCDRILRIEGDRVMSPAIISVLNAYGFWCELLC